MNIIQNQWKTAGNPSLPHPTTASERHGQALFVGHVEAPPQAGHVGGAPAPPQQPCDGQEGVLAPPGADGVQLALLELLSATGRRDCEWLIKSSYGSNDGFYMDNRGRRDLLVVHGGGQPEVPAAMCPSPFEPEAWRCRSKKRPNSGKKHVETTWTSHEKPSKTPRRQARDAISEAHLLHRVLAHLPQSLQQLLAWKEAECQRYLDRRPLKPSAT